MTRRVMVIKQLEKDEKYFMKKIEKETNSAKLDYYWAHLIRIRDTIYNLLTFKIELEDIDL